MSGGLVETGKAEFDVAYFISLRAEYAIALIEHDMLMKQSLSEYKYLDCLYYLSQFSQTVEKHLKHIMVNVESSVSVKEKRELLLGIFNLLNSVAVFDKDFPKGDDGTPSSNLILTCGRIRGLLGKELHFNEETGKFELKGESL